MEKDTFIVCMNTVHNALFKLHKIEDNDENEILMDLVNSYVSMMAGFHAPLHDVLFNFLLSHSEITDEDLSDLYDMLTDDNYSYNTEVLQ